MMSAPKKENTDTKSKLHPRNLHRQDYDFEVLVQAHPPLAEFAHVNAYGNTTINFFDPQAVLSLNKALLIQYYRIKTWDLPKGYLCPPVPGRVDYLHYIGNLLASMHKGKIPQGPQFKCLDIGVGANAIYPILGVALHDWSFIGTDIDDTALDSALSIVQAHPHLESNVVLRKQEDPKSILHGILRPREYMDVVICNPPFYSSYEEVRKESLRKTRNLGDKKAKKPIANFGGQQHELWCEGGELRFITTLIEESKEFRKECFWFTTLVSRAEHMGPLIHTLRDHGVDNIKAIQMGQGNKSSQILAWTFLSPERQEKWKKANWG